jgi:hypothetical protein
MSDNIKKSRQGTRVKIHQPESKFYHGESGVLTGTGTKGTAEVKLSDGSRHMFGHENLKLEETTMDYTPAKAITPALAESIQNVMEGKKLLGTHTSADGQRMAKVYKMTGQDNEGDDHIVQYYEGGKRKPEGDYFAGNGEGTEEDAHGTAKKMIGEGLQESAWEVHMQHNGKGSFKNTGTVETNKPYADKYYGEKNKSGPHQFKLVPKDLSQHADYVNRMTAK